MASPKIKGRMISIDISNSVGFASLSKEAAVLFCLLIPHFNSHGKMNGGPGHIKDIVCPLIPYFNYSNLPKYLKEISDKTNVKWFESKSRHWIHSVNFLSDHQKLKESKLGEDLLPTYSGLSPDLAGSSLQEGEVKEEVKEEVKTFCPNSNEFRLANLLFNLILERDPGYKKPNIQSWAKTFDLLLRVDKRPLDEAEAVLRWSQSDPFWQTNILSADKFRKQYGTLRAKKDFNGNGNGRKSFFGGGMNKSDEDEFLRQGEG